MNKSSVPYKQLIFICTNARGVGERISCAGEGRCGLEILEQCKSYVKENNLESVARIAKSGCQEKCEEGPNVSVMPQNEFLSGVEVFDAESIIDTYLKPLKFL